MPKSYLVCCYIEIRDPEALTAYAKISGPAVEASGGRILARGGRVLSLEGGIEERTIVVEFNSFEEAIAFYNSDDYQLALEALGDGAVRDFRIVEGVE
jgi:uncharacterized protein (DUF1330 family)